MIPVNGMAMAFIVNYADDFKKSNHAPRLAMIATMAGNFLYFSDYVFVIQFNMGLFELPVAIVRTRISWYYELSFHGRKKNTIHLKQKIYLIPKYETYFFKWLWKWNF